MFLYSLLGGALIGIASSLMLLFNGRILGISGILGGLLENQPKDRFWRVTFLLGIFLGGLAAVRFLPGAFEMPATPVAFIVLAGILVGYGTRLGGGCTSGHGVCGVSRLSPRSLAATLVFMLTGALIVFVVRHLGEGK